MRGLGMNSRSKAGQPDELDFRAPQPGLVASLDSSSLTLSRSRATSALSSVISVESCTSAPGLTSGAELSGVVSREGCRLAGAGRQRRSGLLSKG